MTRHKVEICGVDTSKLPVLKNEEMRKLIYTNAKVVIYQQEKN